MSATLTPFQAAISEMYATPRLFGVVTWGAAGSHWLAATLNRIPDLLCLHDGRYPLRLLHGGEPVDEVAWFRMLDILGSGHLAAGDVHGIDRARVPQLRETFGERIAFSVVVRAPRPRLASQFRLFRQHARFGAWDVSWAREIADRHALDLPDREDATLLDVHGINMLNAIVEEVRVGPIFRMEDLVSDPAALGRLVDHLTGGEVRPGPGLLETLVERPPTNAHGDAAEPAPFAPWHQDTLDALLLPEARRAYLALGYAEEDLRLVP